MIRKPPPGAMRDSRSVERLRDVAETTKRVGSTGARLGRKMSAFAGAGCLGWLAFGATISVLSTLVANAGQLGSIRGMLAIVIMLSIAIALGALAIWPIKRARDI